MVVPASAGSFLIASATENPSISGICASSKTRGKGVPASLLSCMAASAGPSTLGQHRFHQPPSERGLEDPPVDGVVVHDEDRHVPEMRHPRVRRLRRQAPAPAGRSNDTVKWNVLPLPGSLSSQMRPPSSATRFVEIARPRPVPPYLRVVEPSAWMNGLKIAACCSCGTPMPVSDTLNRSTASTVCLRLGFDGQHHLAVLGELDGVADEIRDDLAQAAGVAHQRGRHVGLDVADQFQSFAGAPAWPAA